MFPAGDAGPTSGNAYPVSVPSSRQNEYLELDLGSGTTMRLVKIPAGVDSGSTGVDRPFWMGCCEVTNRQYAQINPEHDSRFEHRGSWIFSEEYLGWPLNTPDQPVVRVSWNEAEAWCRQLSARTGRTIRLPSEEEWEYACRGGSSSDFWFGDRDADYSEFANLADASLRRLADDSWNPKPPDLVARDQRYDDRHLVTAKVGSFVPNPFGLHDMHGNVAEWTSGWYGPAGGRRPVRGGSWRDLPADATAAERYGYRAYQKAVHVGFRVVCEVDAEP